MSRHPGPSEFLVNGEIDYKKAYFAMVESVQRCFLEDDPLIRDYTLSQILDNSEAPSCDTCHFCEKTFYGDIHAVILTQYYYNKELGVENVCICAECTPEALEKRWKLH